MEYQGNQPIAARGGGTAWTPYRRGKEGRAQ